MTWLPSYSSSSHLPSGNSPTSWKSHWCIIIYFQSNYYFCFWDWKIWANRIRKGESRRLLFAKCCFCRFRIHGRKVHFEQDAKQRKWDWLFQRGWAWNSVFEISFTKTMNDWIGLTSLAWTLHQLCHQAAAIRISKRHPNMTNFDPFEQRSLHKFELRAGHISPWMHWYTQNLRQLQLWSPTSLAGSALTWSWDTWSPSISALVSCFLLHDWKQLVPCSILLQSLSFCTIGSIFQSILLRSPGLKGLLRSIGLSGRLRRLDPFWWILREILGPLHFCFGMMKEIRNEFGTLPIVCRSFELLCAGILLGLSWTFWTAICGRFAGSWRPGFRLLKRYSGADHTPLRFSAQPRSFALIWYPFRDQLRLFQKYGYWRI